MGVLDNQHCMHSSKKKKGKSSTRDFIRGVNYLHYAHSHKKVSVGACQWCLQKLSVWVSNICFFFYFIKCLIIYVTFNSLYL